MISFGRWLLAFPAGAVAAVAAHFLVTFAFGLGHGFDTVASFWAAPDMNGMSISGTYIVVVTRALTSAVFVGVTCWLVPAFHRYVGVTFALLVVVGSASLLGYLLWATSNAGVHLGLGVWYRNLLEFVSYSLGAIVGAAVGVSEAENHRANA